MLRIAADVLQWHLVRAEGPLDRNAVHLLRAGPALRGAEDDHRPDRPPSEPAGASLLLDGADLLVALVQGGREPLVDSGRIISFHEIGIVAMAVEVVRQFLRLDARQDRRPGDLVAVQVQDRQHCAVVDGI